jgi:diacylglycerol kinase (ATP)
VSDAADRVLIFANPIAGRGRGRALVQRLEKRLWGEGYHVHALTERPDLIDAADLSRPARAAITIGGDGTLRAVADRLAAVEGDMARIGRSSEPACPTTDGSAALAVPPLLVVPLGTANLMSRHLGLKWNDATLEDQVVAARARRQVRCLDTGRANGRLFLLMAGVGFDAQVVHELSRIRKGPISYASYLVPALQSLMGYQYHPLRVALDGKEVFAEAPAVAFVGNVPEYGTGFPILPGARSDDGQLDVCVMPCKSPFDVVELLLKAAVGEHVRADGVFYGRGQHVRIESPDSVPVQVDGDSAGHTPVELDLLPVRLPFIVP